MPSLTALLVAVLAVLAVNGPNASAQVPMPVRPATWPNTNLPAVRDSLFRLHAAATRQLVRDSIERMFVMDPPETREAFARNYAARGDTARAIRMLRLDRLERLSAWSYQVIRSSLEDSARAAHVGQSTDSLFEAIRGQFSRPHYLNGNYTTWCEPTACRAMGQEWARAHSTRLRTVGLLANFYSDPAIWTDTLLRVAETGEPMVTVARDLALGVRQHQPGLPDVPLPSASGLWREWAAWLRGGTDASFSQRDSLLRAKGLVPPARPQLRIAASIYQFPVTSQFVWFAQRRFHVSYADSLEARLARATTDTACYVYRAVLASLGNQVVDGTRTLNAMLSANPIDRARGFLEMRSLRYSTADSATAASVEGTLLDALIDSAPLWPGLTDTTRTSFQMLHAPPLGARLRVYPDSLSPASRERLERSGIPRVSLEQRFPRDTSDVIVVSFGAVRRNGELVRLRVHYKSLWKWPSGGSYYAATVWLARVNGAWRIVEDELIEI